MGSSSSKFRKALHSGDEKTAEEIYHHSQDFQKQFDPNISYGENYDHNTALHCSCRHGMHRLVRLFLQKHTGNPIKRNMSNQTSLHCVCMADLPRPPSSTSSYSQYYYSQPPEKKRAECLRLILNWQGIPIGNGEREKIDINAVDDEGCTALHYASAAGYRSLVETLLENGASLFVENGDKETPCDCAEKNRYYDIAQLLESKMVFSQISDDEVVEELSAISYEESYVGLKPQDLQEAKDALVVETADMLRVPLFTAEALLRNYEWSREALLEEWISHPKECCEKSGVKPPEDLEHLIRDHTLTTVENEPGNQVVAGDEIECDICTELISREESPVEMPCPHHFCKMCWERYLSGKIAEGNAHNIMCPAFECCKLVPVEIIEAIVSREIARRFLQFDIKAFVDTNPSLKWCPKGGCGQAVKLPLNTDPVSPRDVSSPSAPPPMSKAVDCGCGHLFCWDCSGEPHDPCSCENWKKWSEKIAEIKPEKLSKTEEETEIAANCLWLITNSKSCPKCHSPIQKNEGCNHMKCTKCKYDFCWVCLEVWSKHSSETGGYFRCNRYEAVQKVEEKAEGLMSEAEKRNKGMQELNRFLHYYTRFRNHENSYHLEEPLLRKAPGKMRKLACHSDAKASKEETQFIVDAIHELLAARHILKFSYPYGFYLEDRGGSKQIFEFMQNELEEASENLSQMVARNYLRTPRTKIIQAAHLTKRKRYEFLSAVSKGFLPPDVSSDSPQRRRRTSSSWSYQTWDDDSGDENDEALRRAIEESIQDAMAQSQKQEQDEDDSTTDLSRGRMGTEQSQGGSSTMTAGLLRALEMSQLLLMQQTEMLDTPTTRVDQPSSSTDTEQQNPGDGSSPSTSTLLSSRLSPKRGKSPNSKEPQTSATDSFDDDFKLAMELSLQDSGKATKEKPRQTLAQRRSYKTATSTGHSINPDELLVDIIPKERGTRSNSRSHGKSRSGKYIKSDRLRVSGGGAAATLHEGSGESEAERIRRMRKEFLEKIAGTSSKNGDSLKHSTDSSLLSVGGAAGSSTSTRSPTSSLKLDKLTVRKKSSRGHVSSSGKGSHHLRTGRASSDPHTVAIDNTLQQIQARNLALSASVQDMSGNPSKIEDGASSHLSVSSSGSSPAGGSPATRPKIRMDPCPASSASALKVTVPDLAASPTFNKVQRKSLSVQHTPVKKSSLGDITSLDRPHLSKPRKVSEGDVTKLIQTSAKLPSTLFSGSTQPSFLQPDPKPLEDIWKKASADELMPSSSPTFKLSLATKPAEAAGGDAILGLSLSNTADLATDSFSNMDFENGNMVHLSTVPQASSAYSSSDTDIDTSLTTSLEPPSPVTMATEVINQGDEVDPTDDKNDVWQVYI
ncbi:ankyrin repeat and IBR domain-containing protein 1 [Strongylocentrotus purpuratus]|uniref:RBR-type E3 ubiquitin transferase n=1 Tax=Strongylocentrotus purpuratus TaxID=7668 RepID=A0A7M7N4S7_STRPU|nr:ankyrin repeat and IBR domain-containing protein 1 [Strongylocentrotus purpuratus]